MALSHPVLLLCSLCVYASIFSLLSVATMSGSTASYDVALESAAAAALEAASSGTLPSVASVLEKARAAASDAESVVEQRSAPLTNVHGFGIS